MHQDDDTYDWDCSLLILDLEDKASVRGMRRMVADAGSDQTTEALLAMSGLESCAINCHDDEAMKRRSGCGLESSKA
jgi:hypothetical protein